MARTVPAPRNPQDRRWGPSPLPLPCCPAGAPQRGLAQPRGCSPSRGGGCRASPLPRRASFVFLQILFPDRVHRSKPHTGLQQKAAQALPARPPLLTQPRRLDPGPFLSPSLCLHVCPPQTTSSAAAPGHCLSPALPWPTPGPEWDSDHLQLGSPHQTQRRGVTRRGAERRWGRRI